jgi:hypothetical protein
MKTLQRLSDLVANPSGWDSMANYMGEIPDKTWLVVLTRNRDSEILSESNFESALEMLGGESEKVQVFRFGHWACGWWEALAVSEGTEAEAIGQTIVDKLENYPVLNEDDFSEREHNEAQDVWSRCYSVQERIEYIRENRSQFEFSDLADMLGCVRGKYFCGYDSELIQP